MLKFKTQYVEKFITSTEVSLMQPMVMVADELLRKEIGRAHV